MQILKQSTAVDLLIGPFVDSTDGDTEETALTISNTDVKLSKNGQTMASKSDVTACAHDANGMYNCELDATDTNTVGNMVMFVHESGALAVRHEFQVLEEAVYDAMYASSAAGPLQSTTAGRTLDVTATGAAGIDWGNVENPTTTVDLSGTDIQLVDTVTTYTGNTLQTADHTAGIADIPTVAEFNARTLVAASYFDPSADTVANVTTVATTTDVTNQVTADVTAISGDSTAADNLELMYDGTGYTDETAPSSRQQVDNIGASSGAALSYESSADNTGGAIIDSVTIVGTITANLYTDTDVENGTRHQLTHTTNAFDFVYRLPIGGGRTAATVEWRGYLTSSNDSCSMQAYDFVGSSWDTVSTITGTNGTNNGSVTASLLSKHTGTGSEIGNVYVRFICTGQSSPVLNTDLLLVQAVNIGQSVGYALGRVWIDTSGGIAGTENFVNGVADNPVDSYTDGKTIADSLGMHEFNVSPDSSLTLSAALNGYNVYGIGYTLDFNGQDVAGTHFYHASPVTGIALSASEHADILDSIIGNVTVNDFHFTNCTFTGTVTMGTVGSTLRVIKCQSVGTTAPVFNFGTTAATVHNLNIAGYNGHLELQNFNNAGADTCRIDGGGGHLILNANCGTGTVYLNGAWQVTDNSGGSVTVVRDDTSTDVSSILVDTGTTIPATLGTPSADVSADIAAVKVDTAATLVDTAEIGTAGAGLTDLGGMSTGMKAEVNIEVDDVMSVDTHAEIGVETPAATQSMKKMMQYLYKAWRNKSTETATTYSLFNDDTTTLGQQSTVSDDGTTFTVTEKVTG